METRTRKQFFTEDLPQLLTHLDPATEPRFGLMTPQHMVEHLIRVLKSSLKDHGEPIDPPTERQLRFQAFIRKGAVLKHRPSDKTKADLAAPRYGSLDEAMSYLPEAVERFYTHFEAQTDPTFYAPFAGNLTFDEIELFHYQHFRYHLWQFKLLEEYP